MPDDPVPNRYTGTTWRPVHFTSRHGYAYRALVDADGNTAECKTLYNGEWVDTGVPADWPWRPTEH